MPHVSELQVDFCIKEWEFIRSSRWLCPVIKQGWNLNIENFCFRDSQLVSTILYRFLKDSDGSKDDKCICFSDHVNKREPVKQTPFALGCIHIQPELLLDGCRSSSTQRLSKLSDVSSVLMVSFWSYWQVAMKTWVEALPSLSQWVFWPQCTGSLWAASPG